MCEIIKLVIYFFIASTSFVYGEQKERVVNIKQGPVRGYTIIEGVFGFFSIPYATAPTGENKFKGPLPPPIWLETFEAIDQGIICPQPQIITNFVPYDTIMKEDCLIANIYVPDTEEKNLPVLVQVHGGGFQMGLGNWVTPFNLVRSHQVIVVNFNYRLGVHGFLCLGTEDIPGNAGMKDQVALLRWVKTNIDKFGGNPNNVTIEGFSAGSAAVDLLMISPLAKGLFTKVIPESGGNLGPWSVQMNPIDNAIEFLEKYTTFSDTKDFYAMENFYKTASLDVLTNHDNFMDRPESSFLFVPCVEHNGRGSFLDDAPWNILKSGKYVKYPLLYGFSEMEGLFRIPFLDFWKTRMNKMFSDFLPADLQFENEEEKDAVAQKVKQFYFGDDSIDETVIVEYIDYFTDVMFAFPMLKATQLHAKAGHDQVYLYEYNFVDERDTPLVPFTEIRGANHCAQTSAVIDNGSFGWPTNPNESNITAEYRKVKSTMRQLWYNFASTGKPVPEGSTLPSWPAVKVGTSPHMSIGHTLSLRGALLKERFEFWNSIYEKHVRIPVPPKVPSRHTEF